MDTHLLASQSSTATQPPQFTSLSHLPYLRACIKETLRWRPVTAGGLPHALTARDDIYNGYFIRRGSVVHPDQWAIHRDTTLYPDPETFRPERWVEAGWPTYKEPLTEYPTLVIYSCFGFGRRACPGQHIASRSLGVVAMMLVWGCEISVDEEVGRPVDWRYTKGFNCEPERFAFGFREREGRGEVVEQEFGELWGWGRGAETRMSEDVKYEVDARTR